jgi:hypothetical protein
MDTSPDWLERYRTGGHQQVRHEMRQSAARYPDSERAGEAQLVCDEKAHRARRPKAARSDAGWPTHEDTVAGWSAWREQPNRHGGFPVPTGWPTQSEIRRRLAHGLLTI